MSKSFSANLEQSTLIVTMQANPTNTLTNAAFREMIELLNEAKSNSKVRERLYAAFKSKNNEDMQESLDI